MKKTIIILLSLTILVANIWAELKPEDFKCISTKLEGKETFQFLFAITKDSSELFGVKVNGQWLLAGGDGLIHQKIGSAEVVMRNMSHMLPKSIVDGKVHCICLEFDFSNGQYVQWWIWGDGSFKVATSANPLAQPAGSWEFIELPKSFDSGSDGTYIDPTGSIQLRISGNQFTIAFNGRDVASGTVEYQGKQLILRDSRDLTIWAIMEDGSLYTNTNGLAGTWRKGQ